MAAILRVAKESENSLRKAGATQDAELQDLRNETDSWRQESERLFNQFKELKEILHDGRPPSSR